MLAQQLDPRLGVDHRVRAPPVYSSCLSRGPDAIGRSGRPHAVLIGVCGSDLTDCAAEEDEGFVAEGARGEQSPDQGRPGVSRRAPPLPRDHCQCRVRGCHSENVEYRHRPARGCPRGHPVGAGKSGSARARPPPRGVSPAAASTSAANVRRRWLGDEQDDIGLRVLSRAAIAGFAIRRRPRWTGRAPPTPMTG